MLKPLSLCLALAFAPATWADSFTSSAASMASESIGSLSTSLTTSSDSSSDDKKVAGGAYKVVNVAQLADKPGQLRLQLEPAAGQPSGFALTLPGTVAQDIQPGATLWVAERGYGLAFARQANAAPFFLAVDDRLRRDFESVKL